MKPQNKLLAVLGASVLAGLSLPAQEITPVWVQHLNGLVNVDSANMLPILKKQGDSADKADGNSTVEVYVSFLRYDANRYLLGVRENGIDETNPALSQEDRDLATQYPDRSIFWIDAQTGRPLGLALKTEVFPVPLATQSPVHFWWSWGITDGPHGERVIYTGYKYKILRYASTGTVPDSNFPNGRATWDPTPTQAWVEPVPGEPNPTIVPGERGTEPGESGGDGSTSFRMKALRVSGHGSNVVIFAGGATWRASSHEQEFVSDDGGLTLRPVARLNDRDDGPRGAKGSYALGGEPSSILRYPQDPARPNLQITYQAHFPGSGWDARPFRYTRNPDALKPDLTENDRTNRYDPDGLASGGLPAFNWEAAAKDGLCIDHATDGVARYDGNWVMTLDSDNGLDYVVTYAVPSWNNQFGAIKKPGWLGLHTLDGKIAPGQNNAARLPFAETDEVVVANGATGSTYGYEGDVDVYAEPDGSGDSLVLATFGNYGFGVFRVRGRVGASGTITSPANVTTSENQTVKLDGRFVGTGTPLLFWWQKADGGGNFSNIPGKSGNVAKQGVNAETFSLTLPLAQVGDSGSYRYIVGNSAGMLTSSVATVTVNVDSAPPAILSVSSVDGMSVDITFDEIIDTNAAWVLEPFNYSIPPNGGVTSITVRPDGRGVRLNGLNEPLTGPFTIDVSTATDLKANTAMNISGSGTVLGFSTADINAEVGATYATQGGSLTIEAGGSDFWGTTDSGHFVYKEQTGDFDVQVRVDSVRLPSNRNGIMVRESLDPGSPMVHVSWNPGVRHGSFLRATAGGDVAFFNTELNWVCDPNDPPNVWLRLRRSGDLFTSYRSADGRSWIESGSTTLALPSSALLGLAANRGGGTGLSRTTFSGYGSASALSIVPSGAGQWQLLWTGGGVLESAPDVTGPWTDALNQNNPQAVAPAGQKKFFRLR